MIVHAGLFAALIVSYLVVSTPKVWNACRAPLLAITPNHSSDYFLTPLLGAPGGSERLTKAFASLPTNTPVAAIIPDGDVESNFTAYLLTYIAWPREVQLVAVNRENASARLEALGRDSLSAVFFCGVAPPAALEPAIRLGRNLVVVPRAPK
jgi:hypothetical protein